MRANRPTSLRQVDQWGAADLACGVGFPQASGADFLELGIPEKLFIFHQVRTRR